MKYSVLFFVLLPSSLFAQVVTTQWIDLEMLQQTAPKNVVVYLQEDSCSYCLLMEKKTLADAEVQTVLNRSFYFVRLNSSNTDDIIFNGQVFKAGNKKAPRQGHALARYLSRGKGYPALVFLDQKFQPLYYYNGYLNAKQFLQYLEVLRQVQENTNTP